MIMMKGAPFANQPSHTCAQGEGRLELEGVRPLRINNAAALANVLAGTHVDPSVIAATTGVTDTAHQGGDDSQQDLLPSAGLMSSRCGKCGKVWGTLSWPDVVKVCGGVEEVWGSVWGGRFVSGLGRLLGMDGV